jgi:hypothetical protein
MNFATIISFTLIFIYIYLQRNTVWFNFLWNGVAMGYDPNLVNGIQSILVLTLLIGFIIRNEVDNLRSRHKD